MYVLDLSISGNRYIFNDTCLFFSKRKCPFDRISLDERSAKVRTTVLLFNRDFVCLDQL